VWRLLDIIVDHGTDIYAAAAGCMQITKHARTFITYTFTTMHAPCDHIISTVCTAGYQ